MFNLLVIVCLFVSVILLLFKLKYLHKKVLFLNIKTQKINQNLEKLKIAQQRIVNRFFERTKSIEQSNIKLKSALTKLENKSRELTQFFEITPALFCLADKEGRFHMVNAAFCKLLGYSEEELLQREIVSFVHPEDRLATSNDIKRACQGDEIRDSQNRYIARDGTIKVLSWSACSADGCSLAYAAAMDITGKLVVQEKLREQRNLLKAIVDSSPVGLCLVRENTAMCVNKTLIKIMGIEMREKSVDASLFEPINSTIISPLLIAIKQLRKNLMGSVDITILRKDKTNVEVMLQGRLLNEEKPGDDAIITVTDITKRKKYEMQLKKYRTRLEVLLRELTMIEERQRRMIATELHDSIGQDLALMRIRLQMIASKYSEVHNEELKTIIRLLDTILGATRDMTVQLSPPVLSQLGFDAAVDWLLTRLKEEEKIIVECMRCGEIKNPDEEVSVLLFRSIRETMINIKKHAKAHSVSVVIDYMQDNIEVCITDDGAGFDVKLLGNDFTHGFGLFSIEERLSTIGGKVEIDSQLGYGTSVKMWAPYVAPAYEG